jgi:hypothetical protein
MAWYIECPVADINADISFDGLSFSALLLVVPVDMMLIRVLRGE